MSRPSVSSQRVGGLGELGGVQQVYGEFPVRQGLADFSGDEGALPVGAKAGVGQRDRPRVVVQERDADFLAQGGLDLLDDGAEALDEAGQGELGAESQLRIAGRAVPEEHVELVIDEPGERALGVLADELAKLRRGGSGFGDLLLGLLGRFEALSGEALLLREDVTRLALVGPARALGLVLADSAW